MNGVLMLDAEGRTVAWHASLPWSVSLVEIGSIAIEVLARPGVLVAYERFKTLLDSRAAFAGGRA